MKQATLGFGSAQKRKIADIVVLSDDDDDQQPNAKRLASGPVVVASSSSAVPAASGPSTSDPLCVVDPAFDVSAAFNDLEPRQINNKTDLDLLFFKSFLAAPARTQIFNYLRAELPFYRVCYKKGPMSIKTPRYTCVWGKDDTGAPDSAYKIRPRALPTILR